MHNPIKTFWKNSIENNLKPNIYLFMGFLIVTYILYIRLLITRLPKDLTINIATGTNYVIVFLACTWIIISVVMLIVNFTRIVKKNMKTLKFLVRLTDAFDRSLNEVFGFMGAFSINPYKRITQVAEKFYLTFGNKTEGLFGYIKILIQIILVISFFIDIFYFFRLNYFYKSINLLTITLLIRLLFFTLYNFRSNLEDIKASLNITVTGTNVVYSLSKGNEDLNLKFQIQHYALCSKINGYLNVYELVSNHITPYSNILIYTCYLIGWIYVLLHGFNII